MSLPRAKEDAVHWGGRVIFIGQAKRMMLRLQLSAQLARRREYTIAGTRTKREPESSDSLKVSFLLVGGYAEHLQKQHPEGGKIMGFQFQLKINNENSGREKESKYGSLGRKLRLRMVRRITGNKTCKLKFWETALSALSSQVIIFMVRSRLRRCLQLLESNLVTTGRETRDLVIRSQGHIGRK